MSKNTENLQTTLAAHPQHGRRYTPEELQGLAEAGDPWAMCKLDEWERFADVYAADLSQKCPDERCEQYGESAAIYHDEGGEVLDIDHGGWCHHPSRQLAKAS